MSSHEEWGNHLNTSFLQGYVGVLWFPGDCKQNNRTFPLVPLKFEARGNSTLQEAVMGSRLTTIHLWLPVKAITQPKASNLCQYGSYSMFTHKQPGVKNYIAFLKEH